MKRTLIAALTAATLLGLTACGGGGEDSSSAEPTPPEKPLSKAETLLQNMTLEEKVGQLFIIRPEALSQALPEAPPEAANGEPTAEGADAPEQSGMTGLNSRMAEALERYPVGGVAMFQQNILSPAQLTGFVSALQGQSKIPLFVGVDEEGGPVARIANSKGFDVTKYPSMEAIGRTGDRGAAQSVGRTIGAYLKAYGFNLDFAPVADVNTNRQNIVIGNRSFGSDPALVAEMVSAAVDGLHQAGVMSCIKHFPGHGDTRGDTHEGFVSTEKTWEELRQSELIPFVGAFKTTDMVMISHITAPNVTSDGLPASLSGEMITHRLRGELGYDGVVITDALEMGAVTEGHTPGAAAVKAVLAGVDILLMPESLAEAYRGVYDAVQAGTISGERLDESVLRILSLKENYGLLE